MMMYSILKLELKRAFINRFFAISVLIGSIISVLQTVDASLSYAFDINLEYDIYPISVFNSYIGLSMTSVWTYVLFMIFPLIASLPYASSYLSDVKGGYVKTIFIKTKKVYYFLAKLLAVFLSGGTVVLLPLIINLLLTALCVPAVIPDISVGTFPIFGDSFAADLYYTHPFIYILMYDLIIFVTSGVLACTALAFSHFIKYKYVVTLSPFLLFMAISFISSMISQKNPLNISEWILPFQQYQNLSLFIVIMELLVIFCISCFIYFFKGLYNDTI